MLLPQGDRHMEAVETQGAPKQTAVSSSAHPGQCRLQRCGAWDQSGFRQEMQPFTSPGAIAGPSTLTEPQGTAHQAPHSRCLEKTKRSLLGTEHQMVPLQIRLSRCPQHPLSLLIPEAAPSDYTCLLQAAPRQGLWENGSDLASSGKTTSAGYPSLEATAPSSACLTWLLQTHSFPLRPSLPRRQHLNLTHPSRP